MYNGLSLKKTCSALFGVILSLAAVVAPASAVDGKHFFGVEYDPTFTQVTAFPADEDYVPPKPVAPRNPFTYLQPYDGYCNHSDRPEEDAKKLPCQTSNIIPVDRYRDAFRDGNKWMHMACDAALKSVQMGGGPFATVIVQIDDSTNKVLRYWVAKNAVVKWVDPTAHGEVTAIRQACQELGVFDLGHIKKDDPHLKMPQPNATSHCELYTNAEPCPMCYCATRWARIDSIYFAATVYDAAQQGVGFSDEPIYSEMARNYADRRPLGVNCYQCTTDNSLSAFNHYKRSNVGKY